MHPRIFAAALVAFFGATPAWALNKCTDAAGRVTYQAEACPPAHKTTEVKIYGETRPYVPPKPTAKPADHVEPDRNLQGPPQAAPLLALYNRWIDVDTLARSTSRIALSGPVGKMQDLTREVQAVKVAPCAEEAKKALLSLVSGSTEAMIAFMRKDEIKTAVYDVADRDDQISAFERAVRMMWCTK